MQHEGELDDGKEEQRQQPAHQDKVHYRRTPFVSFAPAGAGQAHGLLPDLVHGLVEQSFQGRDGDREECGDEDGRHQCE